MVQRLALVTLLFLILTPSSYSKDFGRFGPVWEIAEPSILDMIKQRLGELESSGELESMKLEMQDKTRAYVARPRPVLGIREAKEQRQFWVDLTHELSRDLKDHQGRVFARAGTVINPLHYSHFNKRIVVIDGDRPAQVEFALAEGNELDTLLVLINGAPLELMRKHQRRFYFDQDAQIVKKFNIEFVPSVISRGDDAMLVTEIPMGEK